MRKIEKLTNQYSVSKTLRFKLIPQGRTLEFFQLKEYLKTDDQLSKDYKVLKELIKRYHRFYIDDCLKNVSLDRLDEYFDLYQKREKTDKDKKNLSELASSLKESLLEVLTVNERFKKLFGKELVSEILTSFVDESEKELVAKFNKFTTYFTDFSNNLRNIYTNEGKSTEVTFRLIDQNLPKYLDNCKSFYKITTLLSEQLKTLYTELSEKLDFPFKTIEEILRPEGFNYTLTQEGIDLYNHIMGGYKPETGTNIKGLNNYINEYNQVSSDKIPQLKQLYKQILSERTSISFLPDKFENDEDVLKSIHELFRLDLSKIDEIRAIVDQLPSYDASHIYVSDDTVNTISRRLFNDWSVIRNKLYEEYDTEKGGPKKNVEKHEKERKAFFEIVDLEHIFKYIEDRSNFYTTLNERIKDCITSVKNAYTSFSSLTTSDKLLGNEANTEIIKQLLDSIMSLKGEFEIFNVATTENKDEFFYGKYEELCNLLENIIPLYNKTRNYLTQKPYSNDKIKLNFGNSQLFNGWDLNKEKDYQSILLRKGGNYFIGIMDSDSKNIFAKAPETQDGEESYDKMIYKLLPGPNKMIPKVVFAKSNATLFSPPAEIIKKYELGTHKTGVLFNLEDCHNLIDFFKGCIKRYPEWNCYDFHFSDTKSYKNIADFYKEVTQQGYKLSFKSIPATYIDECVNTGKLYLFQVYNKDFSEYSKGKKNLHTLYFNELFSEENLKDPKFTLSGGGEMFYRFASPRLDGNHITHPKNQPIKNKNALNQKKESVFAYDLIKDKRFTKAQFSFHVPIKINAFDGEISNKLNQKVCTVIRECDDNYVIGIDRGERHLLYVSVINGKGEIVEQFSFNTIENEYSNKPYKTDYRSLLETREKERDESRKSWKSINGIADLKKGYLSQVVHKICCLVEKYDAIIALEDLNGGFKNSRKKVEKSVYQEFEKALIEKLQFLTFKDKTPNEYGGLRKAYQLTKRFESFQKMRFQNGILFYIPAWNTSKIDPTTGFVDLLKPKYENEEKAKEFINKFKSIRYDKALDLFAFSFDYSDFPKADIDYKKAWTVYSYGDRIENFRNPEKNHSWDNRIVSPTQMLKELFADNQINYVDGQDLKEPICSKTGKTFFSSLLHILALILQMRNSITNSEVDYLISPVMNKQGYFYDSRTSKDNLPENADANGAYHIAKKALWAIDQIKNASEDSYHETSISISNKEWLKYVQEKLV